MTQLQTTTRRLLALLAFLAVCFLFLEEASAQLSKNHYIPPLPGYRNSSLQIQISTPSSTAVTYSIRNANNTLLDDDVTIPVISGTVQSGSPQVHELVRTGANRVDLNANNSNASGLVGYETLTTPMVEDTYGLIIEASSGISVIVQPVHRANRSILVSKGRSALGTDFYAWSAQNNLPGPTTTRHESAHFISVMATEDGTTVTFDGANLFAGFDASAASPANQVELDAEQTFTIRTTNNTSVTGTRITSNAPIAVVSGDVHPWQFDTTDRDGGVDQLLPTDLAGNAFVVGKTYASTQYGVVGADGNRLGNSYVQIVAVADNTEVQHVRTDGTATQTYTIASAGSVANVHLSGAAGDLHYFRATGAVPQPFQVYLNASTLDKQELGGTVLPALSDGNSVGEFCSGTDYVEFAAPEWGSGFMVTLPTADLPQLQVSVGAAVFATYTDPAFSAAVSEIDPDGAGGPIGPISLVRFPGTLTADNERVAFRIVDPLTGETDAERRLHVQVGAAFIDATLARPLSGSYGYFSDYGYGVLVRDPATSLPTDSYVAPETQSNTAPRTLTHCVDVDSACSSSFRFSSISGDDLTFSNVQTVGGAAGADPCFDITPDPVVGSGPQTYTVTVEVSDENNTTRQATIEVVFEWPDFDGDSIPDALDVDDDNDGLTDAVEIGNAALSGDQDLDGVPDWQDVDYVTCNDTNVAGTCDDLPVSIDQDGDGEPNHLDADSDGDGILDIVEGNDDDGDQVNDNTMVADADADGQIDTITDLDQNGLDDSYDTTAATVPNSDGMGGPNFLDTDSDNDGVGDGTDSDTHDPLVCSDTDLDGCDDCSQTGADSSGGDTANDGPDADANGVCNAGDLDDDNDGVPDAMDSAPLNAAMCSDTDADSCDDCSVTQDDGSGGDTANDGADNDSDGLCDTGDPDDDNDGVPDATDSAPLNAAMCSDTDADSCDDCSVTQDDGSGGDTANDGADNDADGLCDAGDPDDDNDGVADGTDSAPLNAAMCLDSDMDGCDDCAITQGDGSGGDPANDGTDSNADGQCDAGDGDSDGDDIIDSLDADTDNDGIPDSVEGTGDSDDDGVLDIHDLDSDNDGIPDIVEAGLGALDADGDGRIDDDTDNDNDGVADSVDSDDNDANVTTTDTEAPDTDDDGLLDAYDLDADGDGIPDVIEGGGVDDDNDGVVDSTTDADEDGMMDVVDPNEGGTPLSVPNTDEIDGPDFQDLDSDADGVPDAVEGWDDNADGVADTSPNEMDANNNGWDDAFDPNAGGSVAPLPDTDEDDTPDYRDTDDDNDGVLTANESPDENDDPRDDDTDNDGTPDYLDKDDDGDGILTANEAPDANGDGNPDDAQDTDEDDTPDYLDNDDDNDGVPTENEQPDPNGDGDPADAVASVDPNVPDYLNANASMMPVDTDADGIPDAEECPADDLQRDSDDDGIRDCEDPDDDNDGILTIHERPMGDRDSDMDGTPDHLDDDDDNDGVLTANEAPDGNDDGDPDDGQDSDGDGTPDYLDTDDDNDGVLTANEAPDANDDGDPDDGQDSDGDGTPDYLDNDDDNDGVLTANEAPDDDDDGDPADGQDSDGDGTPDYLDDDDDNDGVLTANEAPDDDDDGDPADGRDTDGDGTPDYLDTDDDNDGVLTVDENTDDNDNGTPDYLEGRRLDDLAGGGFACSTATANPGNTGISWWMFGLLGFAFLRRRRQPRR